jgi:hypothetical protein
MKAPARAYYYADSTEGRRIYSRAGIRPSRVAQRVDRVMAHAFKRLASPFDDRSHMPVRQYIARMK